MNSKHVICAFLISATPICIFASQSEWLFTEQQQTVIDQGAEKQFPDKAVYWKAARAISLPFSQGNRIFSCLVLPNGQNADLTYLRQQVDARMNAISQFYEDPSRSTVDGEDIQASMQDIENIIKNLRYHAGHAKTFVNYIKALAVDFLSVSYVDYKELGLDPEETLLRDTLNSFAKRAPDDVYPVLKCLYDAHELAKKAVIRTVEKAEDALQPYAENLDASTQEAIKQCKVSYERAHPRKMYNEFRSQAEHLIELLSTARATAQKKQDEKKSTSNVLDGKKKQMDTQASCVYSLLSAAKQYWYITASLVAITVWGVYELYARAHSHHDEQLDENN